jgi:hypothetical protein
MRIERSRPSAPCVPGHGRWIIAPGPEQASGGALEDSGGTMTDRHAKALAGLEQRLRTGPGELPPPTRAAAIDGGPLPDPLAQGYVETLRRHANRLTDRCLEELAAGLEPATIDLQGRRSSRIELRQRAGKG